MLQKDKKGLDEILKEKTSGFEMMPSDSVWASVAQNLDQSAVKNISVKWILLGITFLGVSAALLFHNFTKELPSLDKKLTGAIRRNNLEIKNGSDEKLVYSDALVEAEKVVNGVVPAKQKIKKQNPIAENAGTKNPEKEILDLSKNEPYAFQNESVSEAEPVDNGAALLDSETENTANDLEIGSNKVTSAQQSKTSNTIQNRLTLDVAYSCGLGKSRLQAKNDVALPIKEFRVSHDLFSVAQSARISLRYDLNLNTSFSIGLAYTTWGEKMQLDAPIRNSHYDSMSAKMGYDGADRYRPGFSYNKENIYHTFELPLMVHFEKSANSKMYFSWAAGVSFTQVRIEKPTFMLFNYKLDHFLCEQKDMRRNNINLIGNFSVGYNLNQRISIYAGPEIRYAFFSTYADSYPIIQNQYAISLSSGLTFRLHKTK
jgi:hypothetical protein